MKKHYRLDLPIKGTESDVAGIISATRSIKTVSESRTVMPEGKKNKRLTIFVI